MNYANGAPFIDNRIVEWMVTTALEQYRQDFIRLALACHVLQFGEFELKSGRLSPYFFNAGKFASG